MSRATVTLSDLTSSIVPEGQQVRVVVEHHPVLDEPVELDASLTEVGPMLEGDGQYIVVAVHLPNGEVKRNVVDVKTFDAAFKGDPYTVLKDAKRVNDKPASTGTKRDPAELERVRTWCRANGWPDLSGRGRIPAEAQAAYDAAHAASA